LTDYTFATLLKALSKALDRVVSQRAKLQELTLLLEAEKARNRGLKASVEAMEEDYSRRATVRDGQAAGEREAQLFRSLESSKAEACELRSELERARKQRLGMEAIMADLRGEVSGLRAGLEARDADVAALRDALVRGASGSDHPQAENALRIAREALGPGEGTLLEQLKAREAAKDDESDIFRKLQEKLTRTL
jgi:hypothetical protein